MGKTTIASVLKKEVSFIARNGQTYRFDFTPDLGDVNRNPDKYAQYLVLKDDGVVAPVAETKEEDIIEIDGVKYKKV